MKIYHLTKAENGWQVEALGSERPTLRSDTKKRLLRKFVEHIGLGATLDRPIRLVIHAASGKIQGERTYPRATKPKKKEA